MNWDDMRFFLALSREGSISAAGRSLGVNHTTGAYLHNGKLII